MGNSGGNNYVFPEHERRVKLTLEQLKANNPRVYAWFKLIESDELTDTAFKNYAARFGMSADELKQIINGFQKGESK
ncbi:hypothetical protein Q0590_08505 [Rhodocytophaga aerolata]|uniref:DUF3606 domain-containing protein n=1 Tax=Rhodocytophaga aerolata TaxID=455078 RepID=A0ABT8R6H8_9BACT|nr:hypothetical protein [Rhodocytophaga aerolata]MDO1446290.1 hypothetical protein [Rhodocytophaga aerolata]